MIPVHIHWYHVTCGFILSFISNAGAICPPGAETDFYVAEERVTPTTGTVYVGENATLSCDYNLPRYETCAYQVNLAKYTSDNDIDLMCIFRYNQNLDCGNSKWPVMIIHEDHSNSTAGKYTVKLLNVQLNQTGNYTCNVRSVALGHVHYLMSLTVSPKPTLPPTALKPNPICIAFLVIDFLVLVATIIALLAGPKILHVSYVTKNSVGEKDGTSKSGALQVGYMILTVALAVGVGALILLAIGVAQREPRITGVGIGGVVLCCVSVVIGIAGICTLIKKRKSGIV